MKKRGISLLALIMLSNTIAVHAQSEQDLFDLLDNLANAGQFGYDQTKPISIKSFDQNSITIESPVINDDLGVVVTSYTVQYANAPITELIEQNKVNEIRQKEFTFDTNINGTITMKMQAGADFEASKTYHFSVVPKNNEGFPGNVSNELSFNLADLMKTGAPAPTNNTPEGQEVQTNAIDMCAANISYTQEQNKITLKWTAIANKQVKLSIRHTSQRDFSPLATVKLTDEKYQFVAAKEGTNFVKFEALDDQGKVYGTECIQTLRVEPFKEPQIPTSPKVGPNDNIIVVILACSGVAYILYRKKQLSK